MASDSSGGEFGVIYMKAGAIRKTLVVDESVTPSLPWIELLSLFAFVVGFRDPIATPMSQGVASTVDLVLTVWFGFSLSWPHIWQVMAL